MLLPRDTLSAPEFVPRSKIQTHGISREVTAHGACGRNVGGPNTHSPSSVTSSEFVPFRMKEKNVVNRRYKVSQPVHQRPPDLQSIPPAEVTVGDLENMNIPLLVLSGLFAEYVVQFLKDDRDSRSFYALYGDLESPKEINLEDDVLLEVLPYSDPRSKKLTISILKNVTHKEVYHFKYADSMSYAQDITQFIKNFQISVASGNLNTILREEGRKLGVEDIDISVVLSRSAKISQIWSPVATVFLTWMKKTDTIASKSTESDVPREDIKLLFSILLEYESASSSDTGKRIIEELISLLKRKGEKVDLSILALERASENNKSIEDRITRLWYYRVQCFKIKNDIYHPEFTAYIALSIPDRGSVLFKTIENAVGGNTTSDIVSTLKKYRNTGTTDWKNLANIIIRIRNMAMHSEGICLSHLLFLTDVFMRHRSDYSYIPPILDKFVTDLICFYKMIPNIECVKPLIENETMCSRIFKQLETRYKYNKVRVTVDYNKNRYFTLTKFNNREITIVNKTNNREIYLSYNAVELLLPFYWR